MLNCSDMMLWQAVSPSVCPSVTLRYEHHIHTGKNTAE